MYLRDINANHKPGHVLNGSFRIFSFCNNIEDYYCEIHPELLKIISHHLHLNFLFVTRDTCLWYLKLYWNQFRFLREFEPDLGKILNAGGPFELSLLLFN